MKFIQVLVHYMTRYFIGFLIAFMSSILVAYVAAKSMEDYIIEQGRIQNQNGIDSMNDMVAKMDIINQMLSRNPAFAFILYQQGELSKVEVLKLREANQSLVLIGAVADYVPYVFTLFKMNDLFLSTSQCGFRFEDYYNKFLFMEKEGEDLSNSQKLRSYLLGRYAAREEFVKIDEIHYSNNGRERELLDAVLYLTGSDYTGLNPVDVSCFVIDSGDIVDSIMMPEVKGRGFLYILDTRTGKELLRYGEVPEGAGDCRDGEMLSGEESYRAIVCTQENLRWKIITGVPMSFVEEQLKPVYRLIITYVCMGFLLVVGLTLYFSFRRYTGISKVLFALPKTAGPELFKKGSDEYNLFTDNILELRDKGDGYRKRMEELSAQNEAILLEHLMVMGISTPEERKVFESCFEKEPEFFCVVLVRLCQKEYGDFKRVTLYLTDYVEEHYHGSFTRVYSGVSDELFLFQLSSFQEANVMGIKHMFGEIMPVLTQENDVFFHVGISAIGTGISNISKCYEQARQIVQAQYARGNETVIETYDISANGLYDNPVNIEFLNRLHTLLLCGQETEIMRSLDKVGSYYERMPYLYELQKEQVFYSVRNIFYTVWLHLGRKAVSEDMMPVLSADMKCTEMIGLFKESAGRICRFISQSKKSRNEELKHRITVYLKENFQDAGLSAYRVSREMGISEKYLSQFLKEQTGESFSSYLLGLRLEKAKAYLETTDYSNDQIAELTGFGSVNTFYRNFNRQFGVTPKVYKSEQNMRHSL